MMGNVRIVDNFLQIGYIFCFVESPIQMPSGMIKVNDLKLCFSNYEAWISNPTHIGPSAQVVRPIVG